MKKEGAKMDGKTKALFKAAQSGDKAARDKLIMDNMGLVIYLYNKMYKGKTESDDIIQSGNIGLIKAVDNFDTEKGTEFATYAIPKIYNEMRKFVIKNRMIRIPDHLSAILYKWSKAKRELAIKLERKPTLDEISKNINVSVDRLQYALNACKTVTSLDMSLFDDSGDTLMDRLAIISDIKQISCDDTEQIDTEIIVKNALSKLSKQEQKIIYGRFYQDLTLKELATQLGITREWVRQIQIRALNKMQGCLQGAI